MTAVNPLARLLNSDNSIQTREDWEAYCAHISPPRPERLSAAAYAALDEEPREDYNDARDDWHGDFGTGSTPALNTAMARFDQLARFNQVANDPVKAHLALSGMPHQGKTTIARLLGKKYERTFWKRVKKLGLKANTTEEFCPVVYYSLDSETTPKSLNIALLHFLGATTTATRRYTAQQLEAAVAELFSRHSVAVLILDDFHLLRSGHHNTDGVRSYLKALTSKWALMLLLVGIDLETTDLFEETHQGRGKLAGQTGGRTNLTTVPKFAKGSTEWTDLLTWTEAQLVLIDHQPGTLVDLQAYLWNRTQGSIGSLMRLIRLAALGAIQGNREMIDLKLLSYTQIDFNAEKYGNRRTR
ncbi:TniB family NTP-binding protein [Deinococcus sp. SM5_A1]|uniref:TniB family NTP-binding protein n=1 Tax=Deinococcus sp. SM5_A1 TaxID=3379094 RepID=UPI00385F44C6